MKIKNKLAARKVLTERLHTALKHYRTNYDGTTDYDQRFTKWLIGVLFEVLESVKIPRSHGQLELYWTAMLYLQHHVPDDFKKTFNELFKTNRKVFTKEFFHAMFEDTFNVDSIAFDKADSYEATQYVNEVLDYAANNIYYKPKDEFIGDVMEWYSAFRKGLILY